MMNLNPFPLSALKRFSERLIALLRPWMDRSHNLSCRLRSTRNLCHTKIFVARDIYGNSIVLIPKDSYRTRLISFYPPPYDYGQLRTNVNTPERFESY